MEVILKLFVLMFFLKLEQILLILSSGWGFIIFAFVAFYNEYDGLGFLLLLLSVLTFVIAPFFLLKDIVNIVLYFKNNSIHTAFSYKTYPGRIANEKINISRSIVDLINKEVDLRNTYRK